MNTRRQKEKLGLPKGRSLSDSSTSSSSASSDSDDASDNEQEVFNKFEDKENRVATIPAVGNLQLSDEDESDQEESMEQDNASREINVVVSHEISAPSMPDLQLSDEEDDDEGLPVVPLNNSADDDLESIDSKLLFRGSSPPPTPTPVSFSFVAPAAPAPRLPPAVPSTSKAIPSTSKAVPSTSKSMPSTSKAAASTSTALAIPSTSKAVASTSKGIASLSLDLTTGKPSPKPNTRGRKGAAASKTPVIPTVTTPTPTRLKKNIRKQYSDLIQKCQEFEEKEGFDETMETMMSGNIGRGQELLEEVGGGPGDMFLAFLHTRICSGMLKFKTVNIGSNTSAFKVDQFIESLLEKCMTSDGDYNPRLAVRCISSSATDCCKSLSPMTALVGSFDRDGLSKHKEKEKKRAPRKRQFDETMTQQTQHEVVKYTTTTSSEILGPSKGTSQESFSKEILRVLRTNYNSDPTVPINLFEFTMDKTSFSSTIASLFIVAFLVRDGDVCLYRPDGHENHNYTISIKPDKPPKKNMMEDFLNKKKKKKKRKRDSERSQYIVSFSMKRFKQLAAMSTGEDIISEHRRRVGDIDNDEEDD